MDATVVLTIEMCELDDDVTDEMALEYALDFIDGTGGAMLLEGMSVTLTETEGGR